MASILSLKKRISTAQNVSKTTRAMQMIATSKLKRAQDAALASRPYVDKLQSVTQNLVAEIKESFTHPFLKSSSTTDKKMLLILSPDKGLCGGLVTNLIREFIQYKDKNKNVSYIVIGKKGESQLGNSKNEVVASFPFGSITPSFDAVYPIVRIIEEAYLNNKVSTIDILYVHFTNIFTQTPKIATVLPISIKETEKKKDSTYLFEPDLKTIMPSLLKHYLEMTIYQYLLENFASEQASRMMAMQNATDNAKEIIEELKLEYNKTRQAKITNEILDITSGGAFL